MFKLLPKIKFFKLILITVLITVLGSTLAVAQLGQVDFCTGLSQEFAGFFDCSSNFRSFTEFQGGLQTPEAEGYDESLTRSGDLKTFAKNVANFALGFLGLIAVLIIIYSGFIYVTSRGESDKMENGKKGITYALIGIIIIFSSYALVNTVLQAPGGDSTNIRQGGVRGAANSRSVGSSNFNSMAREVQVITAEVLKDYQMHLQIYYRLRNLTAYSPGNYTSRADFVEYLEFIRNSLNDVRRLTDPLSQMRVAIDATVQTVINPGIQAVQERIMKEQADQFRDINARNSIQTFGHAIANSVSNWFNSNFGTDDNDVLAILECSLPPAERSVNYNINNCLGASDRDSSALGDKIDKAFDNLIDSVVIRSLQLDFDEKMQVHQKKLQRQANVLTPVLKQKLQEKFTRIEAEFGKLKGEQLFEVGQQVAVDFDNIANAPLNLETISSIKDLVKLLHELFNEIKDLKFTVPVVLTSVTEGSAPLVVTFDASQSYSPNNLSIPNANFKWDINGDGDLNTTGQNINCNKTVGSSITCIFKEAGQYTPSLQVESAKANQEDEILAGVVYIPIAVTAPTSKIKLKAISDGGTESVLREYDENGNILFDVNEYSVTLEDAKKGIKFDATGTDVAESDSKVKTITKYAWTFSDSGLEVIGSGAGNGNDTKSIESGTVVGQNAVSIDRKFNQRGSFTVQLAVTDTQGNIDRKIFTLKITDLVARITNRTVTSQALPGTEFVFDAGGSKSDVTPNLEYRWEVVDEGGGTDNQTVEFEQGEVEFRKRFSSPGKKTIKLTVKDNTGRNDTAITNVMIEAQDPTAVLDAVFLDKSSQPNLVLFDGSGSFSPDNPIEEANKGLKYGYRVFNAVEGLDYEVVSGQINSTSSAQNIRVPAVAGNEKLELLFKNKGTFKVELTIEDSFEKRAVASREVVIVSVVDIKFGEGQQYAVQLSGMGGAGGAAANNVAGAGGAGGAAARDAQAEVRFVVESKNADRAQIIFGDGSENRNFRFENGKIETTHIYKKAGSFEVTIRAQVGDDVNSLKSLIIVGGSDSPIAIPQVQIGSATILNLADMPEVNRGTKLAFDASSSINTDGTSSNLRYEWNMGDGRIFNTAKIPSFEYRDLPPSDVGHFEVTLTVTNTTNLNQTDSRKLQIKVVGAKPTLQALVAKPPVNRDRTPMNVTLEAVGAVDRDGKIESYRFYYFPVNDPARELGVKVVTVPSTTMTVKTWGEANQEIEYAFCVDLTDDEGNEVKCNELFANANWTKLTLKNGDNEPPKAAFTVDRTNVKVGESVTFTSSSTDSDGQIIEYTYDLYGDGSFANDPVHTQGTVSFTYDKKSNRDGFSVRLRVMDDKGAVTVSKPVVIFVDGVNTPPKAAFTEVSQDKTVQFRNRSTVDSDKNGSIRSYKWDFDASVDSDGDGDPRNDVDSEEANPVHTYPRSGVYNVTLTVVDNEGTEATVTRQVVVQAIAAEKDNPYANAVASNSELADETPNAEAYRNIIRSNPVRNPDTGQIVMGTSLNRITLNFDHLPRTTRKILIDRNIYFDSDGDGVRNNDVDIERFDFAPVTIEYNEQERRRPTRIQVAIVAADGTMYVDQADLVFGTGSNLQANLLKLTDNLGALIYVCILAALFLFGRPLLDRFGNDNNKKKSLKL